MPRIDRHAIHPDRWIVAALFDDLLPAVVAGRAQTLELAQSKLVVIAVMGLDVIGYGCRRNPTSIKAHGAERMRL